MQTLNMEKHRLAKLANHLVNEMKYNNELQRTHSNLALVESKPKSKTKSKSALKASTKQGKKHLPNKSPNEGGHKAKEKVQSTNDIASLEDRIKVIEGKMPEIVNDLLKTKAQSNDLETKMLHFQNDLELTKRAYSELIYHELSKTSANLNMMPNMKPHEKELSSSPVDSKINQRSRPPSKSQKYQQVISPKIKTAEKKDTIKKTESRKKL